MVKAIISLLIAMCISIPAYASDFCEGFKSGYTTGYNQAKGGQMNPFVPSCPFQPPKGFGTPQSDYEHVYIVGLKKGMTDGNR
jgi:hypothetical protein